LCDLTVLFWLSSYVAGQHLAVALQSGAKDQFCYIVNHINSNLNCEAQRESKMKNKM